MKHRLLTVLWPAFAMAGVLEMLVFAQIDPAELHGLGAAGAGWSSQAVYTLAFFTFWAVISVASSVSLWLARPASNGDEGPTL